MSKEGIRFMLLSTLFFAIMNVLVKMLSHLPAVEIAFFRSIASLSLTYAMIRVAKVSLPGKNTGTLLLRGIFGSGSLILYFITLQRMPLASAVTIQFLGPIFTSIFGIFILHEKIKPVRWIFFIMALSGVLIVQGFDTRVGMMDVTLGLCAAISSALAFNTIRMMKDSEHPLVIIFYFPLITLPVAGMFTAFNFVMPELSDWPILILIGICAQIAQYFMTMAYQRDEVSRVSSMKYIGIIYAISFGYFFFDESITWPIVGGIAVVLVGVILNVRFGKASAVKSK